MQYAQIVLMFKPLYLNNFSKRNMGPIVRKYTRYNKLYSIIIILCIHRPKFKNCPYHINRKN